MKKLLLTLLPSLALFLISSCVVEEDTAPVTPPPPSVNNGLVAYFSFEGNADDLSGNNFHGSIQGARPTADRFGNQNGAYLFDGTDDFISLGNVEEMSFGGAESYTIAAWVRANERTEGTNIIVSKWNGGVLAGWYLGVTDERKAISYRNVVPWATTTEEEVTADEFVHLITSYDGEARELMLYINGELVKTQPFGTHPYDQRTPVLIGALHSRNAVANFYQGVIDDIRIYDRLLNEEEITYLAEN
jgi:hypothetical protein